MRKLFTSELALVAGGSGGSGSSITVIGERSDTSSTFTWSSETTTTTSTTSTSLSDTALGFEDGGQTLEEQAKELAKEVVKIADGLTPDQQLLAEQILHSVEKLILQALQNPEQKIKGLNGDSFTSTNIENLFDSITINVGTMDLPLPLPGDDPDNPNTVVAALDRNNQNIYIDLNHPDIATLTQQFGTVEEAVNFIIAHEFAHALDNVYSNTYTEDDARREAEASDLALRLLDAAGLDAPTVREVNDWYPGNPTGGDDEEGGGELNGRDFADIFGDR